ncbi:hypothetical protein ACTS9V_05805 [Empedobacter falsenii]
MIENKSEELGVAIIFFNRPKPLKEVFEAVRRSKPKRLFLIQDGPRESRKDDLEKVLACRKVVDQVDWECEVHRNYSDVNLSCDHRVFTGISWAFEFVDRLIILEDDCVPSKSFLPFCEDILERYKDDKRAFMISGMNYFDEFKGTNDSYFFSNTAAGWGWATWKRSWEIAVEQKDFIFLEDKYLKNSVTNYLKKMGLQIKASKSFIPIVKKIREHNLKTCKVNSWEYALGVGLYLSSSLVITPKYNLIKNIGLTDDSTHAVNTLKKLDKTTQKLFFKKTFELEFPLKHPQYIIRNVEYEEMHRKLVGSNSLVLLKRRIESLLRRIIFSNTEERIQIFKKVFRK